jgi:hypothetical protein
VRDGKHLDEIIKIATSGLTESIEDEYTHQLSAEFSILPDAPLDYSTLFAQGGEVHGVSESKSVKGCDPVTGVDTDEYELLR